MTKEPNDWNLFYCRAFKSSKKASIAYGAIYVQSFELYIISPRLSVNTLDDENVLGEVKKSDLTSDSEICHVAIRWIAS